MFPVISAPPQVGTPHTKATYFLLLLIFLVFCQNSDKTTTKEKIEKNEVKEHNLNSTNTNDTSSKEKEKSKIPFNMSIDQVDTFLFCSLVVQEKIKKVQKDIQLVTKRLNLSSQDPVNDKAGTEFFQKCTNNVDIKTVNKYIKNLTYFYNFKYEKDFDELTKIDFDKYKNRTSLRFSTEQQILMYKYNKINEFYTQKKADERDKIQQENRKIKIGQIDMDSIPLSFKLGIFLVILILFFGGIFYFLKTLQRKPKEKKKKDKKKKTQ